MKYLIYILPVSINVLELITIVIGIIYYKSYKHTFLKYFLYFLIFGFLTEMVGIFVVVVLHKSNFIIYNLYALVQFIFFLWLFYKYFKTEQYKTLSKFFITAIVLFFILDTFFLQDIFSAFQSYFFFLGGIFLITISILFLVELLNSDAILSVKNLLIFWITIGIFLFQLGFIPVFITKSVINFSQQLTYSYILLILNIISCTCYSIGFIRSKEGIDY